MAAEGVIGVDVIVKVAETAILGQRDLTLNHPIEMVDTTVKTDYPYKTQKPGWQGPWSIKCDGLLMAGGSGGIASIINTVKAGASVAVVVTIGDSGEQLTGNAYMVNPGLSAPQAGEGTMACELQGIGELTATEGT